ncbi:MAG: phosphate ABC transporter substrate-binding protein PstS [Thermoguttaceae bacterium]
MRTNDRKWLVWFAIVVVMAVVNGCADTGDSAASNVTNGEAKIVLNGAGATFPAPVYSAWAYSYSESTQNRVLVNYQGVGSGAGVNQIKEGTIDFAGTDSPLSLEDLEKDGLEQFPMLAGGVVVVYNLAGVESNSLKLTSTQLADIFLGKITRWNDPQLASSNPDAKLPDVAITVVHRSDSSGTSFLFTDYLSKVSSEWKEKVGAGPAVNWPCGIGGQKNPGVCVNVAQTQGAIGYTELTYAIEAKLPFCKLQNKAGNFVAAESESFAAALAASDWNSVPGFALIPTDAAGEKSWPITGVTFILIKKSLEPTKRDALNKYIAWCFAEGKKDALKMHYVPVEDVRK